MTICHLISASLSFAGQFVCPIVSADQFMKTLKDDYSRHRWQTLEPCAASALQWRPKQNRIGRLLAAANWCVLFSQANIKERHLGLEAKVKKLANSRF